MKLISESFNETACGFALPTAHLKLTNYLLRGLFAVGD
jgi:hypothetical protein